MTIAPLLARILELRRDKAELLGFRDFADFVLHDRMAHTGAARRRVPGDLRAQNRVALRARKSRAAGLPPRAGRPDAPELQPWDVPTTPRSSAPRSTISMRRRCGRISRSSAWWMGSSKSSRRLYGIRVDGGTRRPRLGSAGALLRRPRSANDAFLGGFYADWYPRENKRGGAWMDALLTGDPRLRRSEPHLGLICGNLTPPLRWPPALLTHREVKTIFHEFGHLLHHLLSRVEVRSLAGTNVAWDFVELPSQIMENWCWERDALDLFARHYQTGEPLPDDLFQKMLRARNFRARQRADAATRLRLRRSGPAHRLFAGARRRSDRLHARDPAAVSPAPLPADHAMIAGFTHLFASPVGYGAGYYSYKWAEVLDADAFTRFRTSGSSAARSARAFRDKILARGDSEDPAELYRAFMGRDPDPNALLERSGLLQNL